MAEKKRIPLLPGKYYHLYNRGINRRPVFQSDEDRREFLYLMEKHLKEIGTVFAYALMPDHWHIVLCTHLYEDLPTHRRKSIHSLSRVIGHLQNAYVKFYNKRYNYVSSLFENRFERKEITSLEHLKTVIAYVHHNGTKHGHVTDFRDYEWTSYLTVTVDAYSSLLDRELIISKFGTLQEFIAYHHHYNDRFYQKLDHPE